MDTREITLGQSVSTTKSFNEKDVFLFAELSGDHNPLHLEEGYAATTIFKHRVVHGSLVNSLFSSLLGNDLPGVGTIYCKQDSTFLKPVYIGDTITAHVTVKEITPEKNRILLETTAFNQRGEKVIQGTAMVLPPKPKAS